MTINGFPTLDGYSRGGNCGCGGPSTKKSHKSKGSKKTKKSKKSKGH